MNIEQPTSPPDIEEPTAYYRDQARERAILEALSENRHIVETRIIEALAECEPADERRLADALYAYAQGRACGSGGYVEMRDAQALIGMVVAQIVENYIMSIPRWQERANDLAWAAWDDDQEGV